MILLGMLIGVGLVILADQIGTALGDSLYEAAKGTSDLHKADCCTKKKK